MSDAVLGFGTQVKRGNGAGTAETFTAIPEIVGDIKGPGLELGTVDITPHKLSDYYREVLPTLISPGTLSFTINYVTGDTTHEGLKTDAEDRVKRNFQIEWPDGEVNGFAGYITKFNKAAGIESAIAMDVEISITGAISVVP